MSELCFSNSRFIGFLDECGDHSLTTINSELPLFAVCIVVVERETYSRVIIPEMASFKLRYFAHEGINLHNRDIRKAYGAFTILQNSAVRERFLTELTTMMRTLPFKLFVSAIDKFSYIGHHGDGAKNIYTAALEYSFERVVEFMEDHQEVNLPLIAESRGTVEDGQLRASFHEFMTKGNGDMSDRFRRLFCPLLFRRKQDNIAGIQLADLCAHPTARHILKPDQSHLAFESVRGHFYKGEKFGLDVRYK